MGQGLLLCAREVRISDAADITPGACPNLRGHFAETRSVTWCASVVVYPADSIYTRYTRFGKTGEPSGGRMSVPSRVQLMNE